MSSFFITGSGTEVGKTYIAKEIINRCKSLKINIHAIKPIISGIEKDNIRKSDSGILLKALNLKCSHENIKKISPWQFKSPLSPDMASRKENKKILFSQLTKFCKSQIDLSKVRKQILLIEGVGGIMVPINNNKTVLDLIKILKIPVIFVTRNYLGTLSHTLSAIKILKEKNIEINSIILNEEKNSYIKLSDTEFSLKQHTNKIPIYIFKLRNIALSSQIDKVLKL